jgi:hypothetical protein
VIDGRRAILAELNGPDLHRVGDLKGASIARAATSKVGLAFVTTTISRSMVARSAEGAERTLRYSGTYSRPVLSEAGDALLETYLDDGRLIIALQRWSDDRPQPLTAGPDDAFPSFAPGGNSFVYTRIDSNTIMGCGLEAGGNAACRPITIDPLGPRYTVLSPNGSAVAYQTAYGATRRIRMVSYSGGPPSDLGASSSTCPVVWSSPAGISSYDDQARTWREVDSSTGRETGRTHTVPPTVANPCDDKPNYGSSPARFSLRKVDTITTGVRVVDR